MPTRDADGFTPQQMAVLRACAVLIRRTGMAVRSIDIQREIGIGNIADKLRKLSWCGLIEMVRAPAGKGNHGLEVVSATVDGETVRAGSVVLDRVFDCWRFDSDAAAIRANWTKRSCLRCGDRFLSTGRGNHMCDLCRQAVGPDWDKPDTYIDSTRALREARRSGFVETRLR